MPRAKTVVPGRARRRKVLKAAKGNYSGRRKLFKSALQTVQRAGQFAYSTGASRSGTSAACGSPASTRPRG